MVCNGLIEWELITICIIYLYKYQYTCFGKNKTFYSDVYTCAWPGVGDKWQLLKSCSVLKYVTVKK